MVPIPVLWRLYYFQIISSELVPRADGLLDVRLRSEVCCLVHQKLTTATRLTGVEAFQLGDENLPDCGRPRE